jgi:hypothetical protein
MEDNYPRRKVDDENGPSARKLLGIPGITPKHERFQRYPRTPNFTLTLRNAAKRRVSKGEAEAFPRGSSRACILRDALRAPQSLTEKRS